MAGLLNFIRRKSNHELIFWLLDRLAAFFEHLAALTTNPVLKLYIPNAMVVCIYKDVSRDIEVWVGEVKNYIPRSEWSKIVSGLEGIADSHGYVFLDKNGEIISVTRLASDSVEFRFHAMCFGGVVRARADPIWPKVSQRIENTSMLRRRVDRVDRVCRIRRHAKLCLFHAGAILT